jgi:hypothetical protein
VIEIFSPGIGELPKPGRSIAITRYRSENAGMFSSQLTQLPARPWMKTIVSSPWPTSMTFTGRPSTSTHCW